MGRTLAISNRKGGSGKTSSAVNIAAQLAALGQRVLLIDMDTQSHCALGVGIKVQRGSPTLHGFMAGHHKLAHAVLTTQWTGLDLIAGDPLFDHGSGIGGEDTLRRALVEEELLPQYDMVVLDTPPSLDGLLMNALCAADRVLVTFVPHFLAGEGVRQLARVLFRIASRGSNDRLRLLGFLPVMLDSRIVQHRQVMQRLATQFGPTRLLPGIRNDIRMVEAFAAGQPLIAHAPASRAATDYGRAVQDLLERWQ